MVAVGKLKTAPTNRANAGTVIDAKGMAVAPGFINVLSHAGASLLKDGRSMSDPKQGITTEVFGEISWGPVRPKSLPFLQSSWLKAMGLNYDWKTLREFMLKLERKGVTTNFASYVGVGEVRMMVLGEDDAKPTPDQLAQMRASVRQAMEEGVLGVTTMLIYAPDTDERNGNVALRKVILKKSVVDGFGHSPGDTNNQFSLSETPNPRLALFLRISQPQPRDHRNRFCTRPDRC